MAESNLAYDFTKFDRGSRVREKQALQPEQPKYRVVRGAKKADLAGADILLAAPDARKAEALRRRKLNICKAVATCLSLLLMFGIVIYNQAALNEVNSQIAKTDRQISRLKSEYQVKKVELDRRLSLKNAQEIAETELGMVQMDDSQVQYVTVQRPGDTEVKRSGNGIIENVGRALDDAYAYLSGN